LTNSRKSFLGWIQGDFYHQDEIEISNETLFDRYPTFSISNRGNIDGLVDFKDFELKGFYNSANIEPRGIALIHLSTIQNRFFFTFSSVSPLFSKERLELLALETINILENLK
jgi:hypothetical protein